MKKICLGMMAVCLVLGFTACKEQPSSEMNKESMSESTTLVEENTSEQSGEQAAGAMEGTIEAQPAE